MIDQQTLFDLDSLLGWKKYWHNMPEFIQEDLTSEQSIKVHFKTKEDRLLFSSLINQNITDKTRSIWYPQAKIDSYIDKLFVDIETGLNSRQMSIGRYRQFGPQFPLYVVSKNRWESRLTSKALERMGIRYYIVVEAEQFNNYGSVIDPSKILILPERYLDEYDTFDKLGRSKSVGPGAARNFCWDHSISLGVKWHWVMDDNIQGFYRLYRNLKTPVGCPNIFRAMEDFVKRYENISMAGPNYFMFASRKSVLPPFVFNTRIYSCNLIRNDTPYRWRGRYNEDTDLSLRMLKDGWCTVQFNAFLQYKMPTQTIPGGNTEEFYSREGTLPKSQMLVEMHPDVANLIWRFSRYHHYVDYRPFSRNILKPIPNLNIAETINNYGMKLIYINEEERAKWLIIDREELEEDEYK